MELADFDVTRNLPQDLMHVLLEGVFPYHLEQLLNYVVNELSLLTISQINSRVLDFPYAYFSEKPSALNNLSLMGTQSGIIILLSIVHYYYSSYYLQLLRCGNYFTFFHLSLEVTCQIMTLTMNVL